MSEMVAKVDDMGKPVWIALMVLSFVVFWPIGLALLAFLLTSGRLGHGGRYGCAFARRQRHWHRPEWPSRGSGNSAFDEYREQTLERLEEEQRDFQDFLKQLRMAKDRTEFDRFMASRAARRDEQDDVLDVDPDDVDSDEESEGPDDQRLSPGS